MEKWTRNRDRNRRSDRIWDRGRNRSWDLNRIGVGIGIGIRNRGVGVGERCLITREEGCMSAYKNRICRTLDLNPINNPYVRLLVEDYASRAFHEEKAVEYKGRWDQVFPLQTFSGIDLEIGTGNGLYFAHRASLNPDRLLLGIELKFKPLIQSIRRALNQGATQNALMMRFNAYQVERLFSAQELNHIFIHHPDPWPKTKHWKHRLIQAEYMQKLFQIQKTGSFVEFKTDSKDYYLWSMNVFKKSSYDIVEWTEDLHGSIYSERNFVTHFERIFLKKGQPIFYIRLVKR